MVCTANYQTAIDNPHRETFLVVGRLPFFMGASRSNITYSTNLRRKKCKKNVMFLFGAKPYKCILPCLNCIIWIELLIPLDASEIQKLSVPSSDTLVPHLSFNNFVFPIIRTGTD